MPKAPATTTRDGNGTGVTKTAGLQCVYDVLFFERSYATAAVLPGIDSLPRKWTRMITLVAQLLFALVTGVSHENVGTSGNRGNSGRYGNQLLRLRRIVNFLRLLTCSRPEPKGDTGSRSWGRRGWRLSTME